MPFVSNLELNQRLPDVQVVAERFVPALGLQEEPKLAALLVELATLARGERPPVGAAQQGALSGSIVEVCDASHTWPLPPTELVGRQAEIKRICDRLLARGGRLITLVGPPGIGKTRLALAIAAHLQVMFQDDVHFVALAALTDPDLLAATLVAELGISDDRMRAPMKRLVGFFRRSEALLILDNFEQIIPAASLVAELLASCPGLHVLVTSRERLHLRAEQRFLVLPLDEKAAVALFVQRAQAAEANFTLTPENAPILTQICRHLDGLPLAIELSAAHIDLLTPQLLLAQLREQRLDLLTDGPRDLPTYQRTLRSAIDWSYELLNESERRLFRALAVFVGGFTREIFTCEQKP